MRGRLLEKKRKKNGKMIDVFDVLMCRRRQGCIIDESLRSDPMALNCTYSGKKEECASRLEVRLPVDNGGGQDVVRPQLSSLFFLLSH